MASNPVSHPDSQSQQVQAKYRKDYKEPEFLIPTTSLLLELDSKKTKVTATLQVRRNGQHEEPLILDSEVESVESVFVNGKPLASDDVKIGANQVVLFTTENEFELVIISIINPSENTALEGLYLSGGAYCTQCEAEGFRRITPFLDRPDVLSTFTVTIKCNGGEFNHVLSNGNLIKREVEESTGMTFTTWHDPHPKPSYLFAMVAGNFDVLTDTFMTCSGRKVDLEIYVDKGNLHLADHAMSSLKKSMKWDEEKYGLEYDLDVYMIVAVDFFNMGAMENKGLNIFNSKYVLADERTATDTDYHGVEAVIAHEYFHNWTGNRVTCRDWFQLSLKEGLTVFRDQQFSADMGTPVIERISHAKIIRTMQFAQDSGPMAHPIRPDKVIEMNNFYTVTVYDKGAEVIRMMHTLLGEDGFRKGMDLYFNRHDGQAVTCDDFVSAMADANHQDLSRFSRWYSQSGTPQIEVDEVAEAERHLVTFRQSIYGRSDAYQALTIPIKYEVLEKGTGNSIEAGTFILEEHEATLEILSGVPVAVVLFEDFSAPVKVKREMSLENMKVIAESASDDFCRWDMVQSLWQLAVKKKTASAATKVLIEVLTKIINNDSMSAAVKAELLKLPSFDSLAEAYETVDVDEILSNRKAIASQLANETSGVLTKIVERLNSITNGYDKELIGQRSLKSSVLLLLAYSDDKETVTSTVQTSFNNAANMTERIMALQAAQVIGQAVLTPLLGKLYTEFKGEVLVFDKICQLVGSTEQDTVYSMMEEWSHCSEFDRKNPNRMRSLYGAFVMRNPVQFHHESGRGYEFLGRLLVEIDEFNPQLAARLIDPLLAFKQFDSNRSSKMQEVLESLASTKLSKDLFEKVQASLAK